MFAKREVVVLDSCLRQLEEAEKLLREKHYVAMANDVRRAIGDIREATNRLRPKPEYRWTIGWAGNGENGGGAVFKAHDTFNLYQKFYELVENNKGGNDFAISIHLEKMS